MPRKHATLIVAAHRVAEARRIGLQIKARDRMDNNFWLLMNSLLNLYWFEFAGKVYLA